MMSGQGAVDLGASGAVVNNAVGSMTGKISEAGQKQDAQMKAMGVGTTGQKTAVQLSDAFVGNPADKAAYENSLKVKTAEPAAYAKGPVVKMAEQDTGKVAVMKTAAPPYPVQDYIPIQGAPPKVDPILRTEPAPPIVVTAPPPSLSGIWTGIGYSLCCLCIIFCLFFLYVLDMLHIKI